MRYLLLLSGLLACGAAAESARTVVPRDRCQVSSITDGDTLRCADGQRVRLIGIDSPERGQGPVYGTARDALLRLVPVGTDVMLEADVTPRDRYGRTLAWVWAGDSLVNEQMVAGGWAVLYTVPPNMRHMDRLRAAQDRAREAGVGLWAGDGFACLPSDYRRGRCGT